MSSYSNVRNYCNNSVVKTSYGSPQFRNGRIEKNIGCTKSVMDEQAPSCLVNNNGSTHCGPSGKYVFYNERRSLCNSALGGKVSLNGRKADDAVPSSDMNSGYLNVAGIGGTGRAYIRGGCGSLGNSQNPGRWDKTTDKMMIDRIGCGENGYVYGERCRDGCGNHPVVNERQLGCAKQHQPGYKQVSNLDCAQSKPWNVDHIATYDQWRKNTRAEDNAQFLQRN
tara:strand:- start:1117 stop:1788 length:672 start_codon:yes stop_codon:yes gene_type:complete